MAGTVRDVLLLAPQGDLQIIELASDDHDRLTYRGGFGLHFLTCRFEVSRLDVFKSIRLRVFLPILVEVGEFWANVVEFLFPLVVLFASTLDGLHVD